MHHKVLKTVLLVEDDVSLQRCISRLITGTFGAHIIVLIAGTIDEAELIFDGHNQEIDIIFLDTHLDRNVTTFEFTRRISKVFKNSIVAISSNDNDRQDMMKLGCTHECRKSDIAIIIKRIFG